MDLLTSLTSQLMDKTLDGLAERHKAIAGNIANVDTPNYHRRDVSFEGALQQAVQQAEGQQTSMGSQQASNDIPLEMKTTLSAHIGGISQDDPLAGIDPVVTESKDQAYRNDGNSVDIETEMAQLAKNTQKYLALANLESKSYKGLKDVITGGTGG